MHLKYFIFFLPLLWRASLADEFTIDRRVQYNSSTKEWTTQPDSFTIPGPLCIHNGSYQCLSMGGRYIDKCTCECTVSRTTFGVYDNQWKCAYNSRVRKSAGCRYKLYKEDDRSPLKNLPMSTPLVTYYIPYIPYSSFCYLASNNSSYLSCEGTWEKLDDEVVKKRFTVFRSQQRRHYLTYKTGIPSHPTIHGRVIRLGMRCWSNGIDKCVQFKVKGQLNCSVPLTPTLSTSQTSMQTTLQPSPSATTLTSSPASLSYTVLTSSSSSLSHTSRSFPLLPISLMLTPSSMSLYLSRPSIETLPFEFSTTSFTTNNPLEHSRNTAGHIGMIAGTAAGVLVMMCVILTIAIVVQKRKKRSGGKMAFEMTELQNLSSRLGNSVYHNVGDVIHDKPHTTSDSLYADVLDHQETKNCTRKSPKQNASSEKAPLYYELEGPASNGAFKYKEQKGRFTKESPIYNVLEEPSSDGAPVYNNLEELFSNGAPVTQGLRHDNVPLSNSISAVPSTVRDKSLHVYQNIDIQKKDGCDNHGYNESTHSLVDDVITTEERENVYQQLNLSGQRSQYESVYEPLHRNEIH